MENILVGGTPYYIRKLKPPLGLEKRVSGSSENIFVSKQEILNARQFSQDGSSENFNFKSLTVKKKKNINLLNVTKSLHKTPKNEPKNAKKIQFEEPPKKSETILVDDFYQEDLNKFKKKLMKTMSLNTLDDPPNRQQTQLQQFMNYTTANIESDIKAGFASHFLQVAQKQKETKETKETTISITQNVNNERLQAQIILKWLDLANSNPKNDNQKYLKIANTAIKQVIEYYSKAQCNQWGQILEKVIKTLNKNYGEIIAKQKRDLQENKRQIQQLNSEISKIQFENVQKINQIEDELKLKINDLQIDANYLRQQEQFYNIRYQEMEEYVKSTKKRYQAIQQENETLKQNEEQFDQRYKVIENHMKFYKTQNEKFARMIDLQSEPPTEDYNDQEENFQSEIDEVAELSGDLVQQEQPKNDSREQSFELSPLDKADFQRFISDTGLPDSQIFDFEQKHQIKTFDKKREFQRDLSLDTIEILDNDSEQSNIINNKEVSLFLDEKKIARQEAFKKIFMKEIKINIQYNQLVRKIESFVKNDIAFDKLILKFKKQPEEPVPQPQLTKMFQKKLKDLVIVNSPRSSTGMNSGQVSVKSPIKVDTSRGSLSGLNFAKVDSKANLPGVLNIVTSVSPVSPFRRSSTIDKIPGTSIATFKRALSRKMSFNRLAPQKIESPGWTLNDFKEQFLPLITSLISQMFLHHRDNIQQLLDTLNKRFGVKWDIMNKESEKKKKKQHKNQETQTGEYIEKLIANLPYEDFQIHTYDEQNKKLIKIKVYHEEEALGEQKGGSENKVAILAPKLQKVTTYEIEEYLPKPIVDNFLPFDCLMKLKDLQDNNQVLSLTEFEEQRLQRMVIDEQAEDTPKFKSQFGNSQSWKWLRDKNDEQRMQALRLLGVQNKNTDLEKLYKKHKDKVDQKIGVLKFQDRKIVNLALGLNYKETDAFYILSEYHKILQDVTQKFPTKFINLEFIKYLLHRNNKRIKNPISLLPSNHQAVIRQVINQSIEQKILDQRFLYLEKLERMSQLRRFELQLDRLNAKNQLLMQQISEITIQKQLIDNKYEFDMFMRISQTEEFIKNILYSKNMLQQSYNEGFKNGLAQGKFLGQSIEQSLYQSQGQMNGMKHGWISGFEAGQVSGVRKVFYDCYVNGINLFEKIKDKNMSILDYLDIKEMQRDRLNEYYKTFNQIESNIDQTHFYKQITMKFNQMTMLQKYRYKKLSARVLSKLITELYNDQHKMQKKEEKYKMTLIESIFKQINLCYGQNTVTIERLLRVFCSAYLNAVHKDEKMELEKKLFYKQNIATNSSPKDIQKKIMDQFSLQMERKYNSENMVVHYRIIHFVKFCQLSDIMNNLSNEIFQFYLKIFIQLREQPNIKKSKPGQKIETNLFEILNRIQVSAGKQVDVVVWSRVQTIINNNFKSILPENIYNAFKQNVQEELKVVQQGTESLHWIDFDRFMDQSLILYLRFNKIYKQTYLHKIFYAWSLFSCDSIDFDQIYLMLKILVPPKEKVNFKFGDHHIGKDPQQIMQDIHDKFCIGDKKVNYDNLITENFFQNMNAVGGFTETTIFDEIDNDTIGDSLENKLQLKLNVFNRKVQKTKNRLKNLNKCYMNVDDFVLIFQRSNLCCTPHALKSFIESDFYSTDYCQKSLVDDKYVKLCYQKINKLKTKANDILVKLMGTKRYKWQIDAIRVQPEVDLDVPIIQKLVPRTKPSTGGRKTQQLLDISDEDDYEQQPLDDSYEYVEEDLGLKRKKKDKTTIQDRDLAQSITPDLKPYFASMKEWGNRIQRLQNKMSVLPPDLVALALIFYQNSLEILNKKMDKYVENEQKAIKQISK